MSKAAILYCEADAMVLSTQAKVFTKAGYVVVPILGRPAMEKANREARGVVLHASGRHPQVDIAVDSRLGERAVLEASAQVSVQPVAA